MKRIWSLGAAEHYHYHHYYYFVLLLSPRPSQKSTSERQTLCFSAGKNCDALGLFSPRLSPPHVIVVDCAVPFLEGSHVRIIVSVGRGRGSFLFFFSLFFLFVHAVKSLSGQNLKEQKNIVLSSLSSSA